ncbi:MAG: hypothetical protein H7X86_07745 [Gorillibacterium sp.]|nr:hypothetical protein [Gorillibacterium sp.]
MVDIEDKKMFDWMDQLDPEDLRGLDDIEPFETGGPADAAWERIKKRTFAQLDDAQPVTGDNRRSPSKRWFVAACVAFVLFTATIAFSKDVRAEFKKMLQFIPGLGYVQQIEDKMQQTYVLQKPVETEGVNGKVAVDGVRIEGGKGLITLSGDQVSAVSIKTIIFSTEQGKVEFKQGVVSWGLEGPWQAEYYYEGSDLLSGLENTWIQFGETVIGPFQLTQAQKADDLLGFGPSDLQNGIRITGVVTPINGNMRKVNLLTQLPEEQIVDSFGKEPISEGQQLQIMDSKGNRLEPLKDNGFSKPREFIFEDRSGGVEQYQLIVPAIRIIDRAVPHQKVTLPVPIQGSQDIDVTRTIGGLPLNFNRVERIDEKSVRIEVDVHFDATKPRTLQSYKLFTKDGIGMSYRSRMNEKTWAIEMEWLDIIPEQKEISFYIGEPQIVVKGPWVLNLQ